MLDAYYLVSLSASDVWLFVITIQDIFGFGPLLIKRFFLSGSFSTTIYDLVLLDTPDLFYFIHR